MLKSLLLKGIRIIMSCTLTQFNVGYRRTLDEPRSRVSVCLANRSMGFSVLDIIRQITVLQDISEQIRIRVKPLRISMLL